jgi:hypothetical protein
VPLPTQDLSPAGQEGSELSARASSRPNNSNSIPNKSKSRFGLGKGFSLSGQQKQALMRSEDDDYRIDEATV